VNNVFLEGAENHGWAEDGRRWWMPRIVLLLIFSLEFLAELCDQS
jgi:hypothetical protein